MPFLCNCLGVGEQTVRLYLKNRMGEFVPAKEGFTECAKNSGATRCAFKSECNVKIKEPFNAHNARNIAANDATAEAPPPPQYGHN